MNVDLRELTDADPEVVRTAGRELAAIGALLEAGRVDEAIARVDAASARYSEWSELDRAIADLDQESTARGRADATRRAVLELVGKGLAAVVRGAVGI